MAKISYIEKENTTPEIQAMYDQLEKKFGVVPNVVKAMANSPKLLPGFLTLLGASLGPTEVDTPLKELAILTTSKINGCRYCTAHHTAAGKRAGLGKEKMDAAPDYTSSIFDHKERAVVRFANEVTENVAASEESLNELGKHFNESQIAELNIVIGVFNLLTRFADTFKVDLEH
jgi:uncharacterized peroxidase-related enzyme